MRVFATFGLCDRFSHLRHILLGQPWSDDALGMFTCWVHSASLNSLCSWKPVIGIILLQRTLILFPLAFGSQSWSCRRWSRSSGHVFLHSLLQKKIAEICRCRCISLWFQLVKGMMQKIMQKKLPCAMPCRNGIMQAGITNADDCQWTTHRFQVWPSHTQRREEPEFLSCSNRFPLRAKVP